MAKTLRAFTGHNTSGISVEVAESESGNWFFREWKFNGYGKGWTSWRPFIPHWSTRVVNVYSGEESEREVPVLEYGWNTLTEYSKTPRYRLPA